MNHRKMLGKLLKDGYGGRLIIDKDAAFAGVGNFASKDELRLLGSVKPVGSQYRVEGFGIVVEDGGDDALLGPMADGSAEALSPNSSASASMSMDFPAPVSPVSRLSPERTPPQRFR